MPPGVELADLGYCEAKIVGEFVFGPMRCDYPTYGKTWDGFYVCDKHVPEIPPDDPAKPA